MDEVQRKYGSRGFTIVAINVDKKRADAERFLAQFPAHFTVVYDEIGATPNTYGVTGMPGCFPIDVNGNVTFVERGFLDEHKAVPEERVKVLLRGHEVVT